MRQWERVNEKARIWYDRGYEIRYVRGYQREYEIYYESTAEITYITIIRKSLTGHRKDSQRRAMGVQSIFQHIIYSMASSCPKKALRLSFLF